MTSAARWRDLAARAEFRALFVAVVISIAGDQFARVALSVLVYDRTRSAGWTAVTYALTYIPDLVFGPLLGGLADRFPRRRVLVTADLGRAVLVALMALPGLPLPAVIALLVVVQALGAPANAARAATLAAVVPGDEYVLGKAANDMVVQLSQVLGFAGGGVLVAGVGPSTALLVDAATFAVSAVLLGIGLRARPAPVREEAETGWWPDLVAGCRLVAATPRLRSLVGLACVAGCYVTVEGAAIPYAAEVGGGTRSAGLLLAASPAGAVAGMWLLTRVSPERRLRALPVLAVGACVPLLACWWSPGVVLAAILWALSGVASSYHLPASAAFVQAVPDHRRGQAFGVASTALKASQGAGLLAVGVLGDATRPSAAVAILAAVGVLAAMLAGTAWRRAQLQAAADTGPRQHR
jgi:MFS family permease